MDIQKYKLVIYQKNNQGKPYRMVLDENNKIIEDAIVDEFKLLHLSNLPINILLNPTLYLGKEYKIQIFDEYLTTLNYFQSSIYTKPILYYGYQLIDHSFNKQSDFYKQLIEQFPINDKNLSI